LVSFLSDVLSQTVSSFLNGKHGHWPAVVVVDDVIAWSEVRSVSSPLAWLRLLVRSVSSSLQESIDVRVSGVPAGLKVRGGRVRHQRLRPPPPSGLARVFSVTTKYVLTQSVMGLPKI